MFTALLSFLGGSAFRMIWGEMSAFLTKRQELKHEITRIELEGKLAAEQHERNLAAIKLQADLGIKTIEVQAEAAANLEAAKAFREAQATLWKPSGVIWVDAWNASVRPAFATLVLYLWFMSLYRNGWVPTPWDLDLMAGVAGFFFADRTLGKRGK